MPVYKILFWIRIILLAHCYGHLMLQYPHRRLSKIIQIEKGSPMGGFTVVRGKHPIGKGRKDTILLLIREDIKGNIVNFSVIIIDGKEYVPNVYYDFDGRKAEE